MLKSSLYPSIEDIVFKVALEYENLFRTNGSQLHGGFDSRQRKMNLASKKGIGYCRKSDDTMVIYLVIGDFIMEYKGEHYFFAGIPIGKSFILNDRSIAFTGAPKVYRAQHYEHPFVHPDNEICFNGVSRWTDPTTGLNIEWNNWHDTSQKETALKIAKWLEEGRWIIQQGYAGPGGNCHDLTKSNFPLGYKTRVEAVMSGVPIIPQR